MKEQMMVIFYVHEMAWCLTKVVPEEKRQIPVNHGRTDDGNILCPPGRLLFDNVVLEASSQLLRTTSFRLRADQLLMHYDSVILSDLIDLVVSLATVEGGARLDTTGRGFEGNSGQGAGNSSVGSGGHHGGYGGGITDLQYANGK